MIRPKDLAPLALAALAALLAPGAGRSQVDIDELKEQAILAAVTKVAPSVVTIETSGGTELISAGPRGRPVRKGIGPTTGLIVSADGYIISSAFNFANKPTAIIVSVAGQPEKFVARMVATDQTRMLTLLKIEARGLPVQTAVPAKEIRIGQTALALGRTLAGKVEDLPSVSEGIVSAVNRIWGKAVQTDAKVSPTNYGGPLIDLRGRVQGVLVPASPRAEGETAGVEWYDSGIGFAIPMEDVEKALPRLKAGKDLKRGVLGVSLQGSDLYGTPPVVGTVSPGSGADKAGLKGGDRIVAVDGQKVESQAQMRHELGSRYEGDVVSLDIKRGDEAKTVKVTLSGTTATFGQTFLGILPVRDDDAAGIEVRYVYPNSPADKARPAGLKAGDRITKVARAIALPMGAPMPPRAVAMQALKDHAQLRALVAGMTPGQELKLEVVRKEGKKTETVTVTLAEAPDTVPDKLPENATAKKAKAPEGAPMKPETGLLKRTTPAADHRYWIYIPENYDPKIAHALVLWLHPVGKKRDRDLEDFILAWQAAAEDHHFILLLPVADSDTGWTPSDSEFLQQAVRAVTEAYTVDPRRVVAHGMGVGGQMAFYLGFNSRALFRGVATTGAALTSSPKEKIANRPLAFFLVAGGKDPLKDSVKETRDKLTESKYPAIHHEIPNMGHEYLDLATLEQLVRWIDSLDRI